MTKSELFAAAWNAKHKAGLDEDADGHALLSAPATALWILHRDEPRHIHVERAEKYAKYWLEPIELAESRGFRSHELTELRRMIEEHRDEFIVAWDEHLNR